MISILLWQAGGVTDARKTGSSEAVGLVHEAQMVVLLNRNEMT